jgi:hypothetical protein
MNEFVKQMLKMVFAKSSTLTITDMLVLHFHKNFKKEMYHKGLKDKYGFNDKNIWKSYSKLRDENYITFNESNKIITTRPKADLFFNTKVSKKVAYNVLKDVREKWFEKLWKAYPIKIGKKKSKGLFMKINLTEQMFNYILESLDKQIIYKKHMDSKEQFHPEFKHLERWINNEEWDNEVPEINQKKIINLGRK